MACEDPRDPAASAAPDPQAVTTRPADPPSALAEPTSVAPTSAPDADDKTGVCAPPNDAPRDDLTPSASLPQVDAVVDPSAASTAVLPQVGAPADRPAEPARLADNVGPLPRPSQRSSRHEQTGETGIYTERLRRDVFEIVVEGTDHDDIPDIERTAQESGWQHLTGRHPPSLRRFLLFRALPVGLLLAITAWSWQRIDGGRRAPVRSTDSATIAAEDPSPDDSTRPPAPSETAPDQAPPVDVEETVAALKFLDSYAENVSPKEVVSNVQLHEAIVPRKVTLINLWATWCPSCLTELPFLKEVFERQGWYGDVNFVPLMVDDTATARAAYRSHAELMPKFRHFLADRDLSGGPKAALNADNKLPKPLTLPVTLLLDCRRRIHKVYPHAFDSVEAFATLIKDVEDLRRKLDTPACRPAIKVEAPVTTPPSQPPPPAQSAVLPPKPRPSVCGDKICNRKYETCECAQDCPCSPNEQCKYRADGGSACVARVKIEI